MHPAAALGTAIYLGALPFDSFSVLPSRACICPQKRIAATITKQDKATEMAGLEWRAGVAPHQVVHLPVFASKYNSWYGG